MTPQSLATVRQWHLDQATGLETQAHNSLTFSQSNAVSVSDAGRCRRRAAGYQKKANMHREFAEMLVVVASKAPLTVEFGVDLYDVDPRAGTAKAAVHMANSNVISLIAIDRGDPK